jgi:hypothetical protein
MILTGLAMAKGPKGRQNSISEPPRMTSQTGYCTPIVADMPLEDVSDAEKAALLFMREEENLAKNLYLNFYEIWGIRVFGNIALSEQKHEDGIKGLLTKYAIPDPAEKNEPGTFNHPDLQEIYNDLLAAGTVSLTDALRVGATVEELDISDLQDAIENADSADIQLVFENLMKGSRNHLRSYVRLLKLYGQDYEPQYLTQAELDAIIDSPKERGTM